MPRRDIDDERLLRLIYRHDKGRPFGAGSTASILQTILSPSSYHPLTKLYSNKQGVRAERCGVRHGRVTDDLPSGAGFCGYEIGQVGTDES